MASYAFDEFGNMIGGESSEDEAEQPPPAEEEDLSVAPMETDEPEEESRAITPVSYTHLTLPTILLV